MLMYSVHTKLLIWSNWEHVETESGPSLFTRYDPDMNHMLMLGVNRLLTFPQLDTYPIYVTHEA